MITQKELKKRREQVIAQLGEGAVAILVAAPRTLRNGDAHYAYRQDSDFFYLTGIEEPEAVAVLVPGRDKGPFILFNQMRDPAAELWSGPRVGQEGACEQYGADEVFPISSVDEHLPGLLADKRVIYYPMGRYSGFEPRLMRWVQEAGAKVRGGVNAPSTLMALGLILEEMRLHKSADEIALMRRAAEISAVAHRRAMQVCHPGLWEYELEAELLHAFVQQGSRAPAYGSIVGGGKNACVLHYEANNMQLDDNALVLIDAGAEYAYYAADVTRTFPVNGRFNDKQRALYEVVLTAQQAVIDAIKPGILWCVLQEISERVLTEGLVELDLLAGKVDDLVEQKTFRRFYPHRIGHWLGMDVHDKAPYKVEGAWRPLSAGMVLTVEPGLYIPDWQMGVRIEDDVCVTAEGCDVLSDGVPKTISDIETIMED